MNRLKMFRLILALSVLAAGPVGAADRDGASDDTSTGKVSVSEDFAKDWESIRSKDKEVKAQMKVAREQEQLMRDQIQKALESGDESKAKKLKDKLKEMHAENMKEFRAGKKSSKDQKKEFLADVKKSAKPPRGRGKYLESRIKPGQDARNRHVDRRERVGDSEESK